VHVKYPLTDRQIKD